MVGNDNFGIYLKKVLAENHIDISGLKSTDKAATTLAFVHLDDKGDRSFSFIRNPGADTLLSIDDVNYSLIDNCRVFHFGSVSMTHKLSRNATLYAAAYARSKNKIVSYDPNYRPALWESKDYAIEQMRAGLKYADIVKVSEDEMELISGCPEIEEGSELLLQKGVALVCVTMGAKGCYYAHKNSRGHMPTYDTNVVDTTGAGDSFMGALLHGLLKDSLDIAELDENQLRRISDYANAAGAMCAAKRGAIPAMPSHDEIQRYQTTIRRLV
jgi:fructokinase